MEEIRTKIASYYDPLQLLDLLSIDMEELVDALWPWIQADLPTVLKDMEIEAGEIDD